MRRFLCRMITAYVFLIGITPLKSVGAAVIFTDDFTNQKPNWSFKSPSVGFLGELNNNVNVQSVSLNIDVPTTLTANLRFDLLGFRTLDGFNCCTDLLTFSVNGATALIGAYSDTPANNYLISNPSGASVSQLWAGVAGFADSTSGHRFEVPNVQLNTGTNTFTWSYSYLQPFYDEAWGLDNVTIATVPEPSTIPFLILALPFLMLYRRRK